MTIKDVERQTGLTAKSIRYYESKGLLTVERNEENDYRSYSEVEVNRLKKIKLLRYLEFSVEEVKTMLVMEAKEFENVLREKANEFEDIRDRCKDKQELCLSLAKDCKKDETVLNKIVSEYNEFIENIESEETKEAVEELKYLGTPSFSLSLLWTLMFSGPIGWLFINISDGKLEDLMLNAALALLGMVFITLVWVYYFVQRRKYKERVKKKNKGQIWIFPCLILGIVLGIMLIMRIAVFVEWVLMPADFLFYGYPRWAMYGMMWIIMLSVLLIGSLFIVKVSGKISHQVGNDNDLLCLWNLLGKWKIAVVAVGLLAFYCCATSITVVTESEIICHSPIHPTGVRYSYSDVEKITAGVGQEIFSFEPHKRKGEFFYQIVLDGKTITFMTDGTANSEIERYNEHTYLWYEEFDQKLVDLKIPKKSDSIGYENISMGEEYVERFYRILENK